MDAPAVHEQYLAQPPAIVFNSRTPHGSYSTLYFTLETREPCWGVINMTGQLLNWSFTDGLPATAVSKVLNLKCIALVGAVQLVWQQKTEHVQDGELEHIVRIAGDQGSETWPFWVGLAAGGAVHMELSVTYWDRMQPAMSGFIRRLAPPWSTLLPGTSYISEWTFA